MEGRLMLQRSRCLRAASILTKQRSHIKGAVDQSQKELVYVIMSGLEVKSKIEQKLPARSVLQVCIISQGATVSKSEQQNQRVLYSNTHHCGVSLRRPE